jgi:hypothetical protein
LTDKKKSRSKKALIFKVCFRVFVPLSFLALIYLSYFIYNVPDTATSLIQSELKKYNFESFNVEAIAIRLDKAVIGPVTIGSPDNQLKIAKIELNYDVGGLREGNFKSIEISGAETHLNKNGKWQFSGVPEILKGIANYQKNNPPTNGSIPPIKVTSSQLTVHYQNQEFSFPLSIGFTENGKVQLTVKTNLSGEAVESFKMEFDTDFKTLQFKKDAFDFELTKLKPFLRDLNIKNLSGQVSLTDLNLDFTEKKLQLKTKLSIKNFNATINSAKEPINLSFSKLNSLQIEQDLASDTILFKDDLQLEDLHISQGDRYFSTKKLTSKIDTELEGFKLKYLKASSIVESYRGAINGVNAGGTTPLTAAFNCSEDFTKISISANGVSQFNYAAISGESKFQLSFDEKALHIFGELTNIKHPLGFISSSLFQFRKSDEELLAILAKTKFSYLEGKSTGISNVSITQKGEEIEADGDIAVANAVGGFSVNSKFKIAGNSNNLKASLQNLRIADVEKTVESQLDAVLVLPECGILEFIKHPLSQKIKISINSKELSVGDYQVSPFNIGMSGKPDKAEFSISLVEISDIPELKLSNIAGVLDLKESKLVVNFAANVDLPKLIPGITGTMEALQIALKVKGDGKNLKVSLSEKLPVSKLGFKNDDLEINANLSHQNKIQLRFLKSDPFKGEIVSIEDHVKISNANVKTKTVRLNGISIKQEIESVNPFSLETYKNITLKGKFKAVIESILTEGVKVQGISSELPFQWNPVDCFLKSTNDIKIASVSRGGVSVKDLNFKGLVEGLQMKLKESVKLAEGLTVELDQITGWAIPKAIKSGGKTPLPFLFRTLVHPDYGFSSVSKVQLPATDVNKLIEFAKIDLGKNTKVKGKVSLDSTLSVTARKIDSPSEIKLQDMNLYTKNEDDHEFLVKGLNGTLKLSSAIDKTSEDSQVLKIKSVAGPGLNLSDTTIKFKLYGLDKLKIDKVETQWCGGLVEAADIIINLQKPDFDCVVHASKIQMEKVLELVKGVEAEATGTLYGRLNLTFKKGKIIDQSGFLLSEPATEMTLKLNEDNLIYRAVQEPTARKLLEDLKVEYFKILFTGGELEEQKTHFNVKGTSPLGDPPNPLDLSLNLNGPVIYYLQTPLDGKGMKDFINEFKQE